MLRHRSIVPRPLTRATLGLRHPFGISPHQCDNTAMVLRASSLFRYSSFLILVLSAPAFAQQSLPAVEDIKKQVDAGDYRPALQSLTRILTLKGRFAEGYDRVELLLLRAQCQLQLRQSKPALDALQQAFSEAAAKNDAKGAASSLALQVLVSKSNNFQFTPKTRTGPTASKALNILDKEQLSEAYKALFEDEFPAIRQKTRIAAQATTIPVILEAAKDIAALRGIELAAAGGAGEPSQSKPLAIELSSQGRLLLTSALNDATSATDKLTTSASEVVTVPVPRYDPATGKSWLERIKRPRGLSASDVQTIKNVQSTAAQIETSAVQLAVLLDTDADEFKSLGATARETREKATQLLTPPDAATSK